MLKQYRMLSHTWYGKNLLLEQECEEVFIIEQINKPYEGIAAEFVFRFYGDGGLWSFEGYPDSIEFMFGPAKDIFEAIMGTPEMNSTKMVQILNILGYVDKTERVRAY